MKQRRLQSVAAIVSAAAVVVVMSVAGTGTAGASGLPNRPGDLPPGLNAAPTLSAAAEDGDEPERIDRDVPNPLLKESLAEEDEDREAPDEDLTALCQDLLDEPTPYDDPRPNVDVIVDDGTTVAGSSTGCATAQNETTVTVNPFNPRNIVAGANDYRLVSPREEGNDSSSFAYTSFDGGRTWTNTAIPKVTPQTGATSGPLTDMDSSGDPVVAFGPFNTVYYVSLVFSRFNSASGIAVNVSHDGGLTWDDPVIVRVDGVDADGNPLPTPIFNDKPWIAADPFSGRVYVTWTRFEFDEETGAYVQSPIVISTSSDFGRHWTEQAPVGGTLDDFETGITPFAQGSNPKVAPDGSLYVAYETSVCASAACDQATDHDATVIAHSRDHGRTFQLTEVDTNFDFPTDPDSGGGLTGENFRLNSFPQLAIDRLTGRLWITWADDRDGQYDEDGESIRTNGNVIVATSPNGRHWSVKTLGTAADEVFSGVAALAGHAAVTFYTRGFDPDGIGVDYAYVTGTAGSIGHSRVHRITGQSEDPRVQFASEEPETGEVFQGVFIGDYSAVDVGLDLLVHPVWTDFRGRPGTNTPNQDVYTQGISLF